MQPFILWTPRNLVPSEKPGDENGGYIEGICSHFHLHLISFPFLFSRYQKREAAAYAADRVPASYGSTLRVLHEVMGSARYLLNMPLIYSLQKLYPYTTSLSPKISLFNLCYQLLSLALRFLSLSPPNFSVVKFSLKFSFDKI